MPQCLMVILRNDATYLMQQVLLTKRGPERFLLTKCGPERFLLTKCGPYYISVVPAYFVAIIIITSAMLAYP